MNPSTGARLSPINLVLISTNRRVKFSANGNTMRMCVCQPKCSLSHVLLRHLRTSLSVILHSSRCLLLSIRTRAGPTSASARSDAQTDPADIPALTQSGEHFNWDTTRGGVKKGRGEVGGTVAPFYILPHLCRSSLFNPSSVF